MATEVNSPPPIQTAPATGNTLGVLSLVVSLCGFVTFGLTFPIGFVMGLFALRKSPKGVAIAATVIGGLGTLAVVTTVALLVTAAVGFANAIQPELDTENAMSEVRSAVLEYKKQNNELPSDAVGKTLVGKNCDGWGKLLRYEVDPSSDEGFVIRSAGADGVFDTDDDKSSENYFLGMEGFDLEEGELDIDLGDGFDVGGIDLGDLNDLSDTDQSATEQPANVLSSEQTGLKSSASRSLR